GLREKGEVFASCTLGRHDGVMADRPQLQPGSAKRSTWVRSLYLTLEREKVCNLLYGQKTPPADLAAVKEGIVCQEAARKALLGEWQKLMDEKREAEEASRAAPPAE